MNADPPLVAVAVAAALHAGFQVTVSLLVYPVLWFLMPSEDSIAAATHAPYAAR